jgi:hypothetical protein
VVRRWIRVYPPKNRQGKEIEVNQAWIDHQREDENKVARMPVGKLRATDRSLLGRVRLILFIHVLPGPGGHRRRVVNFWEADGQGGHRLVFRWHPESDTFEPVQERHDAVELGRYERFIRDLVDAGEVEMEVIRCEVVEFYRGGT